MKPEITPAYDSLDDIRALFSEYTASLGMDLSFQDYERELADLPGKYAEPEGRLYIARLGGKAAGCAALRPFDAGRCEMKRFYVRPEFRGAGIGGALLNVILRDAAEMRYRQLVLDTMTWLESSIRLYRRAGFVDIEPYYRNPHPDALYLGLTLR